MRTIVSIIMTIALFFTSVPVYALEVDNLEPGNRQAANQEEAVQSFGPFTYDTLSSGEEIRLLTYSGHQEKLILPEKIEEKRVTVLANNLFLNHPELKEIFIPETVKKIGDYTIGYVMTEEGKYQKTANQGDQSVLIHCEAASKAHLYAIEHGLSFQLSFQSEEKRVKKEQEVEKESVAILQQDSEPDSNYDYKEVTGGMMITAYHGGEENLTIPSQLDGKAVLMIGPEAFKDNQTIKKVVLPDGLQSLGRAVFAGCTNLKSLYWPETLRTIGVDCFLGDRNLGHIDMQNIDMFFNINYDNAAACPYNVCSKVEYYWQGILLITMTSTDLPPRDPEEEEQEEDLTYVTREIFVGDQLGLEIVEYKGRDAVLVIPTELEGKPVIKIGRQAFASNSSLQQVVIPDTVREIDYGAFLRCGNLVKIFIPDSIKCIGSSAFSGCSSLQTVKLPDHMQVIERSLFYGCNKLESISMPKELSQIAGLAFEYCGKLKSVYLNVEREYQFTEKSMLPGISVDKAAFNNANESMIFKPYVELGAYLLQGTNVDWKLEKEDTLLIYAKDPAKDAVISDQDAGLFATKDFAGIHRVVLKGITSLGNQALEGIDQVESILVSEDCDLRHLGENAIPDQKLTIYYWDQNLSKTQDTLKAYAGTHPLIQLQPLSQKQELLQNVGWTLDDQGVLTLYSKNQKTNFLEAGERLPLAFSDLNIREVRFDEDFVCQDLPAGLFERCKYLSKITFPQSLKTLGARCFYGCSALKEVELPESLESIESQCFSLCKNLEKVSLSKNLKTMADQVFGDCNQLKVIDLQDFDNFLKMIASEKYDQNLMTYNADSKLYFDGWELQQLEIPEGTRKIPASLFQNQTNLTEVYLPASLEKIGANAFKGCENIEKVHIPDEDHWARVELANGYASPVYASDNIVTLMNLKNGVIKTLQDFPKTKIIHNYAFSNTTIENVILPDNIESLDDMAFLSCSNLKHVQLSRKMTRIEQSFQNCSSLEELEIPENIQVLGNSAFAHCLNLRNVYMNIRESYSPKDFPANLYEIYIDSSAFYKCNPDVMLRPYQTEDRGTLPEANVAWKLREDQSLLLYPRDRSKPASLDGCQAEDLINQPALVGKLSEIQKIEIDGLEGLGENLFDSCSNLKTIVLDASCDIKELSEQAVPNQELYIYYYDKNQTKQACMTYQETYGDIRPKVHFLELQEDYGSFQNVRWTLKDGNLTFYSRNQKTNFLEDGEILPVDFSKMSIQLVTFDEEFVCQDLPDQLFKNCRKLSQVALADSLQRLGKECFAGCESLEYVSYHNALQAFDQRLFQGCDSLQTMVNEDVLYLDEEDREIGEGILDLPDQLRVIPDQCFANCISIQEVFCLSQNLKIGKQAFANCSKLQNADFINLCKRENIASAAFTGCSQLEIYTNLEEIQSYCDSNGIPWQTEEELLDAIQDAAKKKKVSKVKTKKKKVKKKSKRGSVLCIGENVQLCGQFVKVELQSDGIASICNYSKAEDLIYLSSISLLGGVNARENSLTASLIGDDTGQIIDTLSIRGTVAKDLEIHGNPRKLAARFNEDFLTLSIKENRITVRPKKKGSGLLMIYDEGKKEQEPLILAVNATEKSSQTIGVNSSNLQASASVIMKLSESSHSLPVQDVKGTLHCQIENEAVASVKVSGKNLIFQPKKQGKTKITIYADATAEYKKSNTISLTLIVTTLKTNASNVYLFPGTTKTLTVTGVYGTISSSSSDTSIAGISKKIVTAKKAGVAKMTIQDTLTKQSIRVNAIILKNPNTIGNGSQASNYGGGGLVVSRPSSNKLKMTWTKYSSAGKYQIQISTSATFDSTSTITKNFDKDITSYIYSQAVKGKKYYIRMRYIREGSYSKWGKTAVK